MPGILVTGASGFLGRALHVRLAGDGLPVVAAARRAVPGVLQVPDYMQCPVSDITVHAAEEPDRAKVNAMGAAYVKASARVLKALLARTGWMVYVSSGVVYGDVSESPCCEDAPVLPADIYAQAKLHNERLVLEAGGTVLRLSNLFGVGMSANNVLSDIARQLPGEGPLHVRDQYPVRDFLAVDEAAQATALCLRRGLRGVLNLGSGTGLSVYEVARVALRAAGQDGRAIQSTQPSGRRSVNILNISLARQALGWQPSVAEAALGRFFIIGASQ